jgi:hypothetical protein
MDLPPPMIEVRAEQTYRFPMAPAADTVTRGYQVVGTGWNGERKPYYPLFPTDRAWTLVARDGATLHENPLDPTHNFGMTTPTLSWQNGNQRMELYVDGLDHVAWQARYGVEFRVTKNGFVTSKRMSRMLRDYRVSDRLPEAEVRVDYLDLDDDGEAVWDGAGLMSRAMLERLKISPNMPTDQQERLREELKHIGRVEFTMVNSSGQHKGHALVVDDLDVDFRLPRDIKKDAVTTDGTAFVGVNFVHPHDDMRLDMQSIAHLHPFFEEGQMLDYLHQEGELFRQAIESGRQGEAMARLERATAEDLSNWPMRNFFARGGQAQWFPGMVKGLIDGHLERLEVSLERGKLRMPINGGRYYVMTSDVAQAAGMNIPLERGQVHLDPATATAWVHRDDWLAFEGEQGIRHILGGADQDDALWLHGFTDHDGERKVLAWRSPNNIGEYVLLQPTADSQPTVWHTPDGQTELFPTGDSRKLPTRIDRSAGQTEYLGLAQPPAPGELGAGQLYHPDLMQAVNLRTIENAGALGGYCNYTMGYKGATGEVPPVLPDMLENVIDNDVKLGGSNKQVREKISELALNMLQSGRPIQGFCKVGKRVEKGRQPD